AQRSYGVGCGPICLMVSLRGSPSSITRPPPRPHDTSAQIRVRGRNEIGGVIECALLQFADVDVKRAVRNQFSFNRRQLVFDDLPWRFPGGEKWHELRQTF
ncbi:MAG TPA: hypothetical protein PKE16_08335, partial [Hyphomicrobium sp.]|nr:hypothetical protein [Hyphomicrobium sp.]